MKSILKQLSGENLDRHQGKVGSRFSDSTEWVSVKPSENPREDVQGIALSR